MVCVYEGIGDMMDHSEAAVSPEGGSPFQAGGETTEYWARLKEEDEI